MTVGSATSAGAVEVSVIVPLFDGERHLADLLSSLARQRQAPPFEVVVCDNGSIDSSRDVVARFTGRLQVTTVDAAARRGQAHARNRGAELANGPLLLFLDQDDVVDDHYVASMARALATHSIVAARVDTGLLNTSWRGMPRQLAQESRLGAGELGPWGYGGTLGIRRSTLSALGGFDETLPFAGEDVDLCWRARRAGHDLQFVEAAVVHYRFPATVAALLRQGFTYGCAHRALDAKFAPLGVAPFAWTRAAVRVGYFGARVLCATTRASRGQYAFLLGRYWGLLVGPRRPPRRRRLRPGERPHLLVVTASNDRRGAEIEAVGLVDALAARGYPARVVALAPGRGPRKLPIAQLGRSPLAPATLLALRRAARPVDLVVAYGSSALPACAIALRWSRRPFVYRSISDPGRWIRNDLHRRITGLQVRRAARVIALWPAAASSLRRLYRIPAARISVVPNARDEHVFRPPTPSERAAARARFGLPDRPVAAFVGRLTAEKRVDVAIEAVTRSSEHVLLIAGDGPDRVAAERRSTMPAPGRVVFLGELDDIVPVLHAADVVLITSDIEGMPGVAIEAVMCGVPVIAPDIGALSTMPGVHVTGSDAASFSEALDALVRHPPGDLRSDHLDAFSWASVGSVWDEAIATTGRNLGRWC